MYAHGKTLEARHGEAGVKVVIVWKSLRSPQSAQGMDGGEEKATDDPAELPGGC